MKYTIKKGNHFSTPMGAGISVKNTFRWECSFDRSCLYSLDGKDKYDINKLCGVSLSLLGHHIQSARVGWRCVDNKSIQLFYYVYSDGERISQEICTVYPDEKFNVKIETGSKEAKITVEKGSVSYSKTFHFFSRNSPVKYFLKPYFGGNKTAPHDMYIYA